MDTGLSVQAVWTDVSALLLVACLRGETAAESNRSEREAHFECAFVSAALELNWTICTDGNQCCLGRHDRVDLQMPLKDHNT